MDITFENELWKAADELGEKVEVHEYKYVVLGLIFLRYLAFAFGEFCIFLSLQDGII